MVHVRARPTRRFLCCAGLQTWAEMVGLPKHSVEEKDEASVRQRHMLGCLRGFNAAMLYLCGQAWFSPSGWYTDQLLIAEGCMFAITAVDAYNLGVTKFLVAYVVPAILSGVAIASDYYLE
ncbi:MAG: hypothetical protein SGARI_007920 [Bacillariaceae sp.]